MNVLALGGNQRGKASVARLAWVWAPISGLDVAVARFGHARETRANTSATPFSGEHQHTRTGRKVKWHTFATVTHPSERMWANLAECNHELANIA